MTINEILDQARALSPQDRKELTKRLIDLLDEPEMSDAQPEAEHWGRALNTLLDEIGPIEMKYPEIEDPVEWVARLRADQRRARLGADRSDVE